MSTNHPARPPVQPGVPGIPGEAAAGDSGFAGFALSPAVHKGVAGAGFTVPRPIQAETIPAALEGRDVLGLAQTGTGKTAAFALPILERLLATRKPGPRALVLAPTRELANQIDTEIRLLAKFTPVKTAVVYGGVSFHRQVEALRRRPDIIVACPGRLLDLMGERAVRLDSIETLVLDEADHMFDMGFLPDLKRVISALPPVRQNLLFSATMPPEIRGLANQILKTPHVAELSRSTPAETIQHAICPVHESQKLDLLKHLLAGEGFDSAIIFTRTKHRAKRLADTLQKAGHRAAALQGNMSQAQRDRTMGDFRARRTRIMVATDIAARGLDIASVSHVINYDIPNTPDAYTHRIGRTGRSERSGKAFTLVTAEDRGAVRAIERKIGAPIAVYRPEGLDLAPVARSTGLDDSRPPRPPQRPWGGGGSRSRSGGRPGGQSGNRWRR